MGFSEAIKTVFGKYAVFSGRARRSEYWYWCLFNFIVSFALGIVGSIGVVITGGSLSGSSGTATASGLASLWSLIILIPNLAVCVRRLHDIGKSGWTILVELIPVVGWIIMLVYMLKDSEQGPNKYGDSPKYPTVVEPMYSNPNMDYQQTNG